MAIGQLDNLLRVRKLNPALATVAAGAAATADADTIVVELPSGYTKIRVRSEGLRGTVKRQAVLSDFIILDSTSAVIAENQTTGLFTLLTNALTITISFDWIQVPGAAAVASGLLTAEFAIEMIAG